MGTADRLAVVLLLLAAVLDPITSLPVLEHPPLFPVRFLETGSLPALAAPYFSPPSFIILARSKPQIYLPVD